MKSIIQIVLLLMVVVGGVFGATFLTQWTRKPVVTAEQIKPVDPIPKKLLDWPEKTANWAQVTGIPNYESMEVEKGTKGHYDFLVYNVTDKPVKFTLDKQYSCTCANLKVLFGVVPDADRAKLKDMKPLPLGPQLEPYLTGVQWKPQDYDRNGAPSPTETIPASDAAGPRYAIVRFSWETMAYKMTRMEADFVARQGAAADFLKFEVPLTVCPPVIPTTDDVTLGDLNAGETHNASIVIWSPTRAHFDATAELSVADPCLQVSKPRLLSKEELASLPEVLFRRGAVTKVIRAQCAYEIGVTAHERLGDNQLELGPLLRRMVINRGTDSEILVTISATVRGPIQIGEPADRDRVDLRVFKADALAEKMVVIKCTEPNVDLVVDHVKPESMKADLREVKTKFGSRQWNLTISVPPDTAAGPLPQDSAIYLKTNSNPPRRVRIPVAGNASG